MILNLDTMIDKDTITGEEMIIDLEYIIQVKSLYNPFSLTQQTVVIGKAESVDVKMV